jgi:hypothetical protein
MAYDLEAIALEIDQQLSAGPLTLKEVAIALGIHRHTADRALRMVFACSFRDRRAFWQSRQIQALRKDCAVNGKTFAAVLGYANSYSAKRRIRQLQPARTA